MKAKRATVSEQAGHFVLRYVIYVLLVSGQSAYAHTPTQAGISGPETNQADDAAIPARRALLSDEEHAIQWGLHIDSDVVSNLQGGLQRGVVGINVVHVAFAMDTQKLDAWAGGRLSVSALRIDSGLPSINYIGDLQVADNLDALSDSRLYQASYRQRFRVSGHGPEVYLRGGLIDLNENFATTETASLLLNASFGLNPALSANVPVSTYPEPGLGLETALSWSQWQWRLGVFEANPAQRGDGIQHGHFLLGEVAYQTHAREDETATLKLGLWRFRQSDPALSIFPERDWGAYASLEAPLFDRRKSPRVFLQLGHAPNPGNNVPHFLGAGVQIPAPLAGRPYDWFSAGLAHAEIADSTAGSETSLEISYLINLHRFVTLQPDLQYIRHPGGRSDIRDAVVAIMRLHLEFY
jgi:porin